MPTAWKKNRYERPSEYSLDIDGEPLTVFLCRREEVQYQGSADDFWANYNKEIHVVGVASGGHDDHERRRAEYPATVHVIEVPVYHRGRLRTDGLEALWRASKQACQEGKALVIHCNNSFHRGPLLLAALMIKAGHTKADALETIARRRTIYEGHFRPESEWPVSERTGERAHQVAKFIAAHDWLLQLEGAARPGVANPYRPLEARPPPWRDARPAGVEEVPTENSHIAALRDGRTLRVRHADTHGQNEAAVQRNSAHMEIRNSSGRERHLTASSARVESVSEYARIGRHTDHLTAEAVPQTEITDISGEKRQLTASSTNVSSLSKYARIGWLMDHFSPEELEQAAAWKRQKRSSGCDGL